MGTLSSHVKVTVSFPLKEMVSFHLKPKQQVVSSQQEEEN